MYGLEAIAANNGWAIAAVGITIVFIALVALAAILSQLYKFLEFWENREAFLKRIREMFAEKKQPAPPKKKQAPALNLGESARQFSILINSLGEPFSLPKLIEMAEIIGIGKPHSTANALIRAGLIQPDENGFFRWDHDAYQTLQQQE